MATVTIKLPPGIQRDNSVYDTPGTVYDMDQVRWASNSIVPIGGCQGLDATLDSPVRAFEVWENNQTQVMTLAFTDANVFVDTGGTYVDVTPTNYTGPGAIGAFPGYGAGAYGAEDYGNARTNASTITSFFAFMSTAQWGEDIIYTNNADGNLYYYTQSNVTVPAVPIGPAFSTIANATVNASTTGTTFNVHTITSGNVTVGQEVAGPGIIDPVTITSFGTGSGGTGTYILSSNVGTIATTPMHTFDPITTGAPTGCTAVVVTAERHVMAIGYNGNPYSIAWSSQEDPTDWNFQSLTNTAGFLQLTAKTPLQFGIKVPEGILVFSLTEIFLIRFLGGTFVYGGTDPIGYTTLFNPRSIARVGPAVAWPTRRGFQIYQGGAVSPLPCSVQNELLGTTGNAQLEMDPLYGPFRFNGADLGRFSEVWWLYPTNGNTECNRYVYYNYADSYWGIGTFARTAIATADAFQYPLMGGVNKKIYMHEFGHLNDGASRIGQIYVTSSIITLDDSGSNQLMNVKQAQISTGNGFNVVNLLIYGRMSPEGTVYGPKTFIPRADGYTDVRVQYRDIQIEFVNTGEGTFGVGEIRLEVTPGPRR